MSFHFNQGDRPLPGYTIQRGVGRGGFGEVYYATSDGGKEVALKYLRENPQVELRGATHCLNLKSPYLVALHDVKQSAKGEFFVIMEYVGGPSLRDLMNEESGGLGAQKAAYFLREIAKGLAYLHDRGIVHRDLKPGNIFYEDGYVKIGDYGLAKIMAASQHSGQTISVGTVHYMAPEIGSGNYDRTIDVYALGVILYEMLLGRVPYSGSSMGEVLMKHLTAQPEVDDLPAPFPQVIRKALAKDPKDRYQSVNEMMAEVFAVENISQSVASVDSLNLTRMAAAVAKKVKVGIGGGAEHFGTGSSNVPTLDAQARKPPPIVNRDRDTTSSKNHRGSYPLWDDFKRRPFGIGPAASFPQRTRTATGLLGLFLGPWGIHRFYTGHNSIGVYQILATCFTGIGGLWGIIEGIQILMNGDYRDSLGRPLLNKSQVDPFGRSVVARVFWAVLGVFGIFASLGLVLASWIAPPDFSYFDWMGWKTIFFDTFNWMLVGACGALSLGVFALWKASHRGGLSFWRRTVRPAAMCFTAALAGAAFVIQWLIAPAEAQSPLIMLFAVFGLAFFGFWYLQGNDLPVRRSDIYWSRAWMRIFVLVAVAAAVLAGWFGDNWAEANYAMREDGDRTYDVIPVSRSDLPWTLRASYGDADRVIRIRRAMFRQEPLIALAMIMLMVSAAWEAWCRRSMAAKASSQLENDSKGEGANVLSV
ncbi:MAG: protein kinase [Phycisphaerales bacterium]|nr:protein kinase [Phycisphaerales bacterium]